VVLPARGGAWQAGCARRGAGHGRQEAHAWEARQRRLQVRGGRGRLQGLSQLVGGSGQTGKACQEPWRGRRLMGTGRYHAGMLHVM